MRVKLLMAAVLSLLLTACAGMDEELQMIEEEALAMNETDQIKIQSRLDTLNMNISQMAEQGSCTADVQCRTVGVGSRPCGGAKTYYAYSTENPDASLLMTRVSEYDKLEKRLIKADRPITDCRIINDPGAQCLANRCVLRPFNY